MTERTSWPEPAYSLGPRDHVHALGAIAANSNRLELTLRAIFVLYTHMPDITGVALFTKLSNDLRIKTIRTGLEWSGHPESIKGHVAHFLKAFETLARNRNLLMHSTAIPSLEVTADSPEIEAISFQEASRNNPLEINTYRPSLEELRAIADHMYGFLDYGRLLYYHILQRYEPQRFKMLPDRQQARQHILPDRPPLPPVLSPAYL